MNDVVNDVDDLTDGEPPEIRVNEDDTVDIIGQEIEQPPTIEEEEKPVEEVTAVSTEEPVLETNPFEQAFNEAGLDKQYPGGVEDLIRRQSDMNKYRTQLEQHNAELRKQVDLQGQPKLEPPSPDTFYEDPYGAVNKAVDQRMQAVDAKLEEYEFKAFASSKKDYEQMRPEMARQLNAHPELESLGVKAFPILYSMSKAAQIPQMVNDATKKAQKIPPDKSRAETTTGKPQKTAGVKTMQDWVNMSADDIAKEIGVVGD